MGEIQSNRRNESAEPMTALRSVLFVIWLYGSMVVLGLTFLPLLLLPRVFAMTGIKCWAYAAKWGMEFICGAKTDVKGLENIGDTPVLVASKHQSTLDTILPFIYLKDPCIVLKKELLWYPIFGFFAMRTGMIAIDRSGSMKALKEMTQKAKAARDEGRSILIFPEGTRNKPGAEPDYKPGIALLYKELGMPCLPVALSTGLCWPAKGVMRYPGTMTVEFLPHIEPGLSRKAFMSRLENTIETASNALLPTPMPEHLMDEELTA